MRDMIVGVGAAFLIVSAVAVAIISIVGTLEEKAQKASEESVDLGYTGCYICSGGKTIRYHGFDTFLLRKKVERLHGCYVVGLARRCISSTEVRHE
jgi:hypothetical protein